jgi:hypothetical protein
MTAPAEVHDTRRAVLWATRGVGYLVYLYFVVVEIVLALGFLLLLFGANPSAGFVEWVYRSVDRAMDPFRGIFAPIELGTTGNDVEAVFDTSILFAMVIYGIVALALSAAIAWLNDRIHRIDDENRRREERAAYERALAATRPAPAAAPPVATAPPAQPAQPWTGGQPLPAQQPPAQQAPGQQAPGQQAPGQQAPGQQAPGQQAPGQQAPGQQAPGGQRWSAEQPPGGPVPRG